MKRYLIIPSVLLLFFYTNAQNLSGNTWCFGDNAELSFTTGTPVSVNGCAIETNEGCASVSNKNTGALLFYSDGTNVWDATNNIMPSNTIPLGGNSSSTQSAIIVPYPGSNTKYYLFTVDFQAGLEDFGSGNGGVSYCIIDMSLNGGLGDVAQQPQTLVAPTCEKITATKMANNAGYWLVTHLWSSNTFSAYPVTAAGIGNPVSTNIGVTVYDQGSGSGVESIGYLKISPDGSKIAIAHDWNIHTVQVFSFNDTTGVISGDILSDNTISTDLGDDETLGPYGISFSPNSQLLYMTAEQKLSIYQYNLAAGNAAAVLASRNVVGTGVSPFAVQLGPDLKMYIAEDGRAYLDRIANPNVYGNGCNFVAGEVSLTYGTSTLGLPDFLEDLLGSVNCTLTYANCSGDTTLTFADTALSGAAAYLWNFGDPSTGVADTSSSDSAVHNFSASGSYTVTLTITTSNGSFTITKNISVSSSPPVLQVSTSGGICSGDSTQLTASSSDSVHYLWSPSAGLSCTTCANPFASPDSSTEYYVQATDSSGCVAHDSIKATVSGSFAITIASNKIIMCPEDSAQICVSDSFSSYVWNVGPTTRCIYVHGAGDYYATATNAGNCIGLSNHVSINVYPSPPVEISANGDTLYSYDAVTYQWYRNNVLLLNATMSTYVATQSGSYTVEVSDTNGCTETSSPYLITGMETLNGNEWVKVYPNPSVNGIWQVAVSQDLIGSSVEIYDAEGRLVYKSEIQNQISNISLNVARGIYTMALTSGNNSYNLKLVKLQ